MARLKSALSATGYIGDIDHPNFRYSPELDLVHRFWESNIYFIQGHPDGCIKIGIAGIPFVRLVADFS